MRKSIAWVGRLGLLGGLVGWAGATRADVTAKDQKLLDEVATRLVAEMDRPPGYDAWPPTFKVVEKDVPNAYACLDDEAFDKGKRVPRVVVFTAELVRTCERDPDVLALTVGHELGHVALGHILPRKSEPPVLVQRVFDRQEELDADNFGASLVLKAGYSRRGAVKNITAVYRLSSPYSSLEGLDATHPAWADRAARLDETNRALWHSLSAFRGGVFFLLIENYPAAARSFRRVVADNDKCYEAHANLGYALLMDYCDRLDARDLEAFKVGQIVVTGFYQRPKSLEELLPRTRGQDTESWESAVKSLRKALDLKPNLALAQSNLGLAYLLRPQALGGPNPAKALEFFRAAARTPDAGELAPAFRATLVCNTGVAQIAAGQTEAGLRALQEAETLARGFPAERRALSGPLTRTVAYNRAVLLADSPDDRQRREAVTHLENYLKTAAPSQTWWQVGYDRYRKLADELGVKAASADALRQRGQPALRPVVSVRLGKDARGQDIEATLADPIGDLLARLGAPDAVVPVVPGFDLRRLHYLRRGVALLATGKELVAVFFKGEHAPPLELRGRGAAGTVHTLRVGMKTAEVERILGGSEYDYQVVDNPEVPYRFYSDLGVGVRIVKGAVVELVVARVPHESAAR